MPPVSKARRVFTLEDANRTLPLVSRVVRDIVRISGELKETYQEARRLAEADETGRAEELQDEFQRRKFELQEYIEELERIGCELKDPDLGLVDFPARLEKRVVFLCWKLGEPEVAHWHELNAGFAGRKPVEGTF